MYVYIVHTLRALESRYAALRKNVPTAYGLEMFNPLTNRRFVFRAFHASLAGSRRKPREAVSRLGPSSTFHSLPPRYHARHKGKLLERCLVHHPIFPEHYVPTLSPCAAQIFFRPPKNRYIPRENPPIAAGQRAPEGKLRQQYLIYLENVALRSPRMFPPSFHTQAHNPRRACSLWIFPTLISPPHHFRRLWFLFVHGLALLPSVSSCETSCSICSE